MSMDELLLQELYGSQQVQAEQQIKQAQIELVEAVAAEAGVDLNELDDAELAKFAHYVLSDEDEPAGGVGKAYAEQTKLAEADLVGRQMAHSYADEMSRIQNGETMRYNTMSKVASAMSDVADAWHMQKVAEGPHTENLLNEAAPKVDKADEKKFMDKLRGYGRNVGEFTGVMDVKGRSGLNRAGRLAGTAGALGALGYGGYRLATRNKDHEAEKISMYLDAGYEAAAYAVAHSPEEFAKEAEFRAAEILLANGVDPATLEQVYPENVKIASFPTPDDAISYREAAILEEYNDMLNAAAMHIIENLD